MRFIHNFRTLTPGGLNQDFSFKWLARAHTRLILLAHFKILKFSATNSHIFPDEGSIAGASTFYLQLSAFNLHLPTFNIQKRYAGTPVLFVPFFFCLRWNGSCIPYNKLQNAGRLRPKGFLFQASRIGHRVLSIIPKVSEISVEK